MSTLKVVVELDERIYHATFGNVKSSSDLITLVFYLIEKELGELMLRYFDKDFNEWIVLGEKVKVKDLPSVLKLKCFNIQEGSYYEGRDYKTVRHEEEVNELTEVLTKEEELEEPVSPGVKSPLDAIKEEELPPDDLINSPYSANAEQLEGIFEVDDGDLNLDGFGGMDLD